MELRTAVKKHIADIQNIGTTPNGVFGVKIMASQMDAMMMRLRLIPGMEQASLAEALGKVFSNPKYIYLSRADKIAQAVSYAKAIQSGLWYWIDLHDFVDEARRIMMEESIKKASTRPLNYDFEQIAWCLKSIKEEEASWEEFFLDSGIEPLRLVYEELERNAEAELLRLLTYLGISGISANPLRQRITHKILRNYINIEWAQRFRQNQPPSGIVAMESGWLKKL